MKKILYLVTEDWYFWSHRKKIAEQAVNEGYEVIVATNPGDYTEKIKQLCMEVVPIRIDRSSVSPIAAFKSIFDLIKIYRRINPDLVHHVSLKPIMLGSIAAWMTGRRKVINAYTGMGFLFISSSWVSTVFKKMCVPFLSLLFCRQQFYSIVQNKDDERLLEKVGLIKTEKYFLIPGSGVDTEKFKYTPEEYTDTPIVMFASRLLVDKGICEFIAACEILIQRKMHAKYVVVGDIDMGNPSSIGKPELKDWVENNIIEWWGNRDDMYKVITNANIICLPSYREGLPKILLEAASVGRAIVTTDVPGCREIVTHNENGLLVKIKDPLGLADAIESLLHSSDKRRKMGMTGRARVENEFDVNIINKQTINLYNTILNKS